MATRDWTTRLGLCSVTLRHLAPEQVVALAARAGLSRVEWGADVHARPDDPGRLAEVREATTAAGLVVASYGTYWKAGLHRAAEAAPLLAAAHTLGARRLRVWAGDRGTDVADADWWDRVATDLRELSAAAADTGLQVALEFHPQTLTDSVASTRRLLDRVDHPALRTYWQPRLDEDPGPAVAGLAELLDVVVAVHVFSWWPAAERLPLADRADLWTGVLGLLTERADPLDLLLEFVPGDDEALLTPEAATLRRWVESATG